MASNLSILISAKDSASGPLSGITKMLQGLGHAATAPLAGIGNLTSTLGKIGLAGMGISVVTGAISSAISPIKEVIGAASDMNESLSKAQTVFKGSFGSIDTFASNSAKSMGLPKQRAMEMAGTFGNLFSALGLADQASADMSKNVLTLGADLGSFNNLGTDEVLEKLRAGLTGEAEPLKSMGINMTAAGVDAKMLSMGLDTSTDAAKAASQVQARYAIILEQTKNAQGDFAKTSTGMANSTKIIDASLADMKVTIGNELLPVVAPLISQFASALPGAFATVMPYIKGFGAWFVEATQKAIAIVGKLTDILPALWGYLQPNNTRDIMRELFGDAGPMIDGVVRGVRSFAEEIGRLAGVFQSSGIGGVAADLFGQLQAALPGWLSGISTAIGSWIQVQIPVIIASLQTWGAAFVAWIGPMIPPLLLSLGGLITQLVAWIVEQAPIIAAQVQTWAVGFVNWIVTAWPGFVEQANVFIGQFTAWISAQAAPIIAQLQVWAQALIAWIVPATVLFLQQWPAMLDSFLSWIGEAAGPILAKLGDWALKFVEWIAPMIPPFLLALAAIALAIGVFIVETGFTIGKKILTEWVPALYVWVATEAIPRLVTAVWGILTELNRIIGDIAVSLRTSAIQWGISLVNGMIAGLAGLGGALQNEINNALSSVGLGGVNVGIAGYRAAGGPVSGGSAYLVGERGPEIFSPRSSGSITPNSNLGGTTNTYNVSLTINGAGPDTARQAEIGVQRAFRSLGMAGA